MKKKHGLRAAVSVLCAFALASSVACGSGSTASQQQDESSAAVEQTTDKAQQAESATSSTDAAAAALDALWIPGIGTLTVTSPFGVRSVQTLPENPSSRISETVTH